MPGSIFVTQPVLPEALEFLRSAGHDAIEANSEDRVLSRDELVARMKDTQGALTQLTDPLDADVIASLPGLRVISNVAVGFNNIDLAAANRLGILVTNTPGVLTETTADFAWALLMAAARRVVEGDRLARSGRWAGWRLTQLLGHDVYGKTLGLVGFGRIGQAVARRAAGFGMTIQYCDTQPIAPVDVPAGVTAVSFDTLVATSDFISVHEPLQPATTHLFNDATFAAMKRSCIFVNTARGPVVDEPALARALASGTIAAAGLDVFEREPAIEPALVALDNVVLAPHIASASRETRLKMCMMAVRNLVAGLAGDRPPNLVNPDAFTAARR